jgi:hypothetical protein
MVLFAVEAVQGAPRPRPTVVAVGRPDEVGGYSSRQILVRCARRADDPGVADTTRLELTSARWGVRHCRPAYAMPFSDPSLASELGLDRTFVLDVPPGIDAVALANAFAGQSGIESVELDGIGGVAGLIPNDEDFGFQWNMHNVGQRVPPTFAHEGLFDCDIDGPEAWNLSTGVERPVIVAVVDSGIDPHVEFAERMLPGRNVQDPENPNFTGTSGCPHGNHVAGIIAATGNNGSTPCPVREDPDRQCGVAGVNWGALLMPIRVTDDDCAGTESDCANGILWAVEHGAEVINLSLQYYGGTQTLQNAVQYAHERGVLLVAANGNGRRRLVAFPAKFPETIAVSATNLLCNLSGPSNYGPETDLSAPGHDVYSTWPTDGYISATGTSMAAPHVAGLASLIKAYKPRLSNGQIRTIMENTAVDLGSVGWDERFGFGQVNAHQALLAAELTITINSSNPPDGAVDARQPSEPDGSRPTGWRVIEITFDDEFAELAPGDFSVTKIGGMGVTPSVAAVSSVAADTIILALNRSLEPVTRTTITYLESQSAITLNVLPGDVNGDGVSDADDVLALKESLDDPDSDLPEWSWDMDRSRVRSPLDLIRLMDLFNGAEAYMAYFNVMLP